MRRGAARVLPGLFGLLGLLALFSPLVPAVAHARPELLWYLADFPPSSIQDGPMKGRGYLDRMLVEVLHPLVPSHRPRVVDAPPVRFYEDARTTANVCSPAVLRTEERERTLHVSQPLFRFLPVGLVVRSRDLPRVQAARGDNGAIDLRVLVKDPALRIGWVGARRHGGSIDRIVAEHPLQFSAFNSTRASHTLLRMTALGRGVDGVLTYAFEIPYLESQYPELRGSLAWLPVRDQPAALFAHVACSRSDEGRSIIEAIDRGLRTPQTRQRAQALYEEWLDPASRRVLTQQRLAFAHHPDAFWTDLLP